MCICTRFIGSATLWSSLYTARVPHIVTLYIFSVYRQVCVCVICKHVASHVPRDSSRDIRQNESLWQRAAAVVLYENNNNIISDCLYRQAAPAATKIHNIPTYVQVLSSFCFVCFFFHGVSLWIETVTHADDSKAWCCRFEARFAILLRVRPKT